MKVEVCCIYCFPDWVISENVVSVLFSELMTWRALLWNVVNSIQPLFISSAMLFLIVIIDTCSSLNLVAQPADSSPSPAFNVWNCDLYRHLISKIKHTDWQNILSLYKFILNSQYHKHFKFNTNKKSIHTFTLYAHINRHLLVAVVSSYAIKLFLNAILHNARIFTLKQNWKLQYRYALNGIVFWPWN